jgi:uncharacterized protein YecE (DUF72 family)
MPCGLHIGTSGWDYPEWRDDFYAGVPRKNWLAHYAAHFSALEINATFYHLQRETTFAHWHDTTPPGFRFAIKGNRYLTHNRRLRDPQDSIALERDRSQPLGDKLAVVLWQLPARFGKDLVRLDDFATALMAWPEPRHAVEFRDRSWFDAGVADCLAAHRIANCQSDAADWPLWDAVTTDLVYLRLHGHSRTYASAYSTPHLARWADRIRGWLAEGREVHAYFDNTASGAAIRDARRLADMLAKHA